MEIQLEQHLVYSKEIGLVQMTETPKETSLVLMSAEWTAIQKVLLMKTCLAKLTVTKMERHSD